VFSAAEQGLGRAVGVGLSAIKRAGTTWSAALTGPR